MKRLVAWSFVAASLAALLYVEKEAQAQAAQLAKPFTGMVNKAVAGTISRRLQTRGFAANDPIYAATMSASQAVVGGAVVVGSVAATVAAVGTAPVWLSVALGVGALYEIYDFSVGQYEFRVEPGTAAVKVTAGTQVSGVPVPPPYTGGFATRVPSSFLPFDYANPGPEMPVLYPQDMKVCGIVTASGINSTFCGGSVAEVLQQAQVRLLDKAIADYNNAQGYITAIAPGVSSGPTKIACTITPLQCPEGIRYNYGRAFNLTIWDNASNSTLSGSLAWTISVFNNPAYLDQTKRYSVNDAVSKLSPQDLSAHADPELLAAIANRIWQQAAQQPGYQGAPYDVNNPVTAQDIANDIAAGVYPHPTNADLLSMVSPTASALPTFDPAAEPVANTAGETVNVDFGPDPGIATPGLEAAPTGAAIVSHVMGLLPSMSAFTIPAHAGACVMPSFDFFGHAMSMNGACDVVEPHRALLSTIFTAIWGVAALVVVLRA